MWICIEETFFFRDKINIDGGGGFCEFDLDVIKYIAL